MNKEVLAKSLERFRSLPAGETWQLTSEEAGVLKAFLAARQKADALSDGEKSFHQKIASALSDWEKAAHAGAHAGAHPSGHDSFRARTQSALRDAIDKVIQGRWSDVAVDDFRLLRGTLKAYQGRKNLDAPSARLVTVLTEAVARCEAKKAEGVLFGAGGGGSNTAIDASVFSSGVSEDSEFLERVGPVEFKHRVQSPDAFPTANRRPIEILDGIEADLNAATFAFEGDTLVTGDVASDVLIEVTGGSITINGFVTGSIRATGDIVVNGNVQGGILLSENGDIRISRALVHSRLIAKSGSVFCDGLENPRRVFAWKSIAVRGAVLGGKLFAATITIEGKVLSGELHSCGEIKAPIFETGAISPCIICLRSRLTCEDYGRLLDTSMATKQQRIGQLEGTISLAEHMSRSTIGLVHNCFRTAIFYLVGGVRSATAALDLHGLQAKAVYLRQIIGLSEGIAKFYRVALENIENQDTGEVELFHQECLESLKLIESDIQGLPDEFGSFHRRYLLDKCMQVRALTRSLHDTYLDGGGEEFLKVSYMKALSEWREVQRECEHEVERIIERFGIEPEILDEIERRPEGLEGKMEQYLTEIRNSGTVDQSKRASSPLIRLLKTSAERYRSAIDVYQKQIATAKVEMEQIRGSLAEDAAVLYGSGVYGSCFVRATEYDRGTVITTAANKTTGFDSNLAEVIVISDPIKSETVFRLKGTAIQRHV